MPDIDDPFKPPDATVLRPRPGAGRRGRRCRRRRRRRGRRRRRRGAAPRSAARCDVLGIGLNPLVRAASPLLLLAGQLRGTLVGARRRRRCAGTRSTRSGASRSARAPAGVAERDRCWPRATRCAPALDEAVLSTPWGAQSEWAQQTLLVALHREAWGGEKFFEMLDRISAGSRAPHRPDGAAVPLPGVRLRRQVPGRATAATRSSPTCSTSSIGGSASTAARRRPELSLRWRGLEDRRNPLIRYVPWWVVGAGGARGPRHGLRDALRRWLGSAAAPVQAQLASVGLERLRAPAAGRRRGADAEAAARARGSARGLLSVDEDGGRTLVTLLAAICSRRAAPRFNRRYAADAASASPRRSTRCPAACWSSATPTISRCSRCAIATTSSCRASAPSASSPCCSDGIDNAGRIEWTGVGSSQPQSVPSPIPRTGRAIGASRSSTCAGT